jgi:uncharacterized protein YabE (DUF348 family)
MPASHPTRRFPARLMGGVLLALIVVGAVYAIYRLTYKDVTLEIGGEVHRIASRAETVGDLLAERRVILAPGDMVSPAPDTPLEGGMTIAIDRAHPVVIEADGEIRRVVTVAVHPLDILHEQGISIGKGDVIRVDGHDYRLETLERTRWDIAPASILVLRSATLRVLENGTLRVIHTTQREVGQALDEAGIDLYLADTVEPGLSATVEDGMSVTLRRSQPVTIMVDGRTLTTRATGLTVGDVLAAVGVAPVGEDYTEPPLEARFEDGMTIRVIRVVDRLEIETVPVPYTTIYRPDFSLPQGEQRVVQAGVRGERTREVRVRYEDGQPVERTLIDEAIAAHPQAELIAYGVRPN